MVLGGIRAAPFVKRDVEAVEVLTAARGDLRDELLRRHAALLRGDHDRGAVDVVRAHEVDAVAGHAFVPHPDVGLDVLHDVAHVEDAVRIGKRGGHEKIALTHLDRDLVGEDGAPTAGQMSPARANRRNKGMNAIV